MFGCDQFWVWVWVLCAALIFAWACAPAVRVLALLNNRHRKISGYRELSQAEIDLIKEVKAMGPLLQALYDKLMARDSTDKRWIAEGRTDLQKGLMSLTRGITKPDFF